jgi:hypothetical protein
VRGVASTNGKAWGKKKSAVRKVIRLLRIVLCDAKAKMPVAGMVNR